MKTIIPVTAAIIRRNGHILITQRKAGDSLALLWEFPGGKLEFGERPEDGIRREIREELGMEIAVHSLFGVESHVYGDRHILLMVYDCSAGPAEAPRALDVGDFAWVTVSALGEYAFAPADQPVVRRLQGFERTSPK